MRATCNDCHNSQDGTDTYRKPIPTMQGLRMLPVCTYCYERTAS